MNIYGKLAEARKQFHQLKMKKSGKNDFQGYRFFSLEDFVIPAMECLRENGLVPVVSFTESMAVMSVFEIDGDGSITITSPMSSANLKGCHPVQNVGAVQTYQRRYLWTALMEIIEKDAIDTSAPVEDEPLATEAQKAKIVEYQESGVLPKRREAWIKAKDAGGRSHWSTMTAKHADSIIDECEVIAREKIA